MPTYIIPPDTRAVGTGNPPVDFNTLDDIVALLTGIPPGGSISTGTVPLVPNSVTITAATGATSSPLDVEGSTNAGQLVFVKQTGTTDHAATVYLSGTGGASSSALNVVSDNSAFSCLQVSGTETGRGTVKITHKGYAAASDGSAAALSIDLQTTVGGVTGTAAQGIFITSTTDAAPAGNALTVRYNGLDQLVVKSSGRVALGNIAIGHVPAGQLEIAPMDTSTVGLFLQALAGGTDLLSFKDSGGTQRLQVNNSGNLVMRANGFVSTSFQVGAVSGDFGGGSSCISIKHATDPSTNPTAGCIIYVDAAGNLMARTSAGNQRTLALV